MNLALFHLARSPRVRHEALRRRRPCKKLRQEVRTAGDGDGDDDAGVGHSEGGVTLDPQFYFGRRMVSIIINLWQEISQIQRLSSLF